jgi:hypothetical protein
VATGTSGNSASSSQVSVTAQNPAGSAACFIMDADVSVHGKSTATTPAFPTATTGETLLAFASSDGPAGAGKRTVTISARG